mmetsp:Transcript_12943/g.45295  ORF Transcript_12943/g.45295 Transcript_12943/m.45295 type:complete len:200 (+) Transcript_12943:335-934(+)
MHTVNTSVHSGARGDVIVMLLAMHCSSPEHVAPSSTLQTCRIGGNVALPSLSTCTGTVGRPMHIDGGGIDVVGAWRSQNATVSALVAAGTSSHCASPGPTPLSQVGPASPADTRSTFAPSLWNRTLAVPCRAAGLPVQLMAPGCTGGITVSHASPSNPALHSQCPVGYAGAALHVPRPGPPQASFALPGHTTHTFQASS